MVAKEAAGKLLGGSGVAVTGRQVSAPGTGDSERAPTAFISARPDRALIKPITKNKQASEISLDGGRTLIPTSRF